LDPDTANHNVLAVGKWIGVSVGLSLRLANACAVQVDLLQARVAILQDHGIVERYKSWWGIGWWVEVGPELVQGKT
jgi:hypothetical protein